MAGKLIGDLATEQFSAQKRFWGPIVTEGSLSLVYAKRGIGKSFLVLKIAHAIATASHFLKWTGSAGAKVLYIDGEMGYRALQHRILAIDEGAPISARGDSMKFLSYESMGPSGWNLSDPTHQQLYEQAFQGFEVIVLDNLLSLTAPRDKWDDDVKQWQRIQPWFVRLRDAGKAIILVHHSGKQGEQLGTSQRENIMDTILSLRPVEGVTTPSFYLRFEKTRHFGGPDADELKLDLNIEDRGITSFTFTSATEERTRRVQEMLRRKISPRQIAVETKLSLFEVVKIRDELRRQAGRHYSEIDSDDNNTF